MTLTANLFMREDIPTLEIYNNCVGIVVLEDWTSYSVRGSKDMWFIDIYFGDKRQLFRVNKVDDRMAQQVVLMPMVGPKKEAKE